GYQLRERVARSVSKSLRKGSFQFRLLHTCARYRRYWTEVRWLGHRISRSRPPRLGRLVHRERPRDTISDHRNTPAKTGTAAQHAWKVQRYYQSGGPLLPARTPWSRSGSG